MKRFIASVFIFACTIYVVQYIVYLGCKHVLDKHSKFRMSRYFRSPKHAYFVLGNSRGVNSIDERFATETLHLDLINLSFNGEPYNNIVDMLDDVNASNTLSVIYLEITCLASNDFDNSFSYYMSNSSFIKRRYSGTVYNGVGLTRLDNELFLRNIYYLRKSDNDWINTNTITPAIIREIDYAGKVELFPDKVEFAARLDTLQNKCNAHGNRLVYFLAPYYPRYLDKIADYRQVTEYMKDHASRYTFIDLNAVPLSNDMFADRVHTNINGARLLTDALLKNAAR